MSSQTYSEAQETARKAIESEHVGLFLSVTRVAENGSTDIELISGVDSDVSEGCHGKIRLEQAAMHIQYLSDISGLAPMQIAGEIAKAMEKGEIEIEPSEQVLME